MERFEPFFFANPNAGSCIPLALTFDDILMVPQYSNVQSRQDCSLKSFFSKNVKLNIPIVSSPMDTVTESQMAIAMATNGGLGVIHRFMTIQDQVKEVEKVLRAQSFILTNPVIVQEDYTFAQISALQTEMDINTFLVTSEKLEQDLQVDKLQKRKFSNYAGKEYILTGILTGRDIKYFKAYQDKKVKDMMTPLSKVVHKEVGTNFLYEYDSAKLEKELLELMYYHKIEKVPITQQGKIKGIVFLKDLESVSQFILANKDEHGRLLVAASIGGKDDYIERAKALIQIGVSALVVDIANGHSQICIDAVEQLVETFPNVDIIAGSVASGQGAERLIKAGAAGIRCGIGNGSICITRIVSGAGVPQFSALLDVAPVCHEYKIPLISDGGNKNSGNMCKALGVGASCIMLGRLLAGCDESPSQLIYKDNKIQKVFRGMAGYGANLAKAQRLGNQEPNTLNFTPEGVEGYIPYAGKVEKVIKQFSDGIKSGMSYSGSHNIEDLQKNVKFIRISSSSKLESGVHSIKMF